MPPHSPREASPTGRVPPPGSGRASTGPGGKWLEKRKPCRLGRNPRTTLPPPLPPSPPPPNPPPPSGLQSAPPALRLVDAQGVCESDFVQLTEIVRHGPAVELDDQLALGLVHVGHAPDVAVEDVLGVVVLRLQHLVAEAEGGAEALDGRPVGGRV